MRLPLDNGRDAVLTQRAWEDERGRVQSYLCDKHKCTEACARNRERWKALYRVEIQTVPESQASGVG